jgi:Icc-related predicted phosphoesterase
MNSSNSKKGDEMDWEEEVETTTATTLTREPNAAWELLRETQIFVELPRTRGPRSSDCTRFVFLSDTHGRHEQVRLPPGDVLVHAGDFTRNGEIESVRSLSSYFEKQRLSFREIICIAGNHELTFHPRHYQEVWSEFHEECVDPAACRAALRNCVYLEDASHTTERDGGVGEIRVYGSPWTPRFFDWAFNLSRGRAIREKWRLIPDSTDVLITHGPPLGRGDCVTHNHRVNGKSGGRVGCVDLLEEVQQRVRPRVHAFGHIHEDRGCWYDGTTLYINASNVDLRCQPVHPCYVVDLPHDRTRPAMLVEPACKVQGRDLQSWFAERGFHNLAEYAAQRATHHQQQDDLPSGNELLDSHKQLCEALFLHRDYKARRNLQDALLQMYVESFG